MPFATATEWPPISLERCYGQRGVVPPTFAWPPAGDSIIWQLSDAPPPVAKTAPSKGATEDLSDESVIKLARGMASVPKASNDALDAMHRTWVVLHAWEAGENVYGAA